jgi:putative membrane protein
MDDPFTRIFTSLGAGVPVLLLHFATTLVLLAAGVLLYMAITPFRERELIREGNLAAGIMTLGIFLGVSIPLAATLATSAVWLDVVLWGAVAVVLQVATFLVATLVLPGLRHLIEAGNTAAALAMVGVQLAVALLNAGAMAG